ncbi:hypothetical protein [Methylobacterium gossipiicola]|uniref:Uncharacterized protein n=1 Tax=Methylobacterium gossipiicola TaxID=582675 RepID=A0A1I2TJF3_9HYPH|nr:hypothetical protein [Methylobacterium gossipiicola]SFG65018.1 hypothetical protein SAMN05192565_107153 [Methylobacterium gossipiicola]
MIDYLFSFPDEATAHQALDPLGFGFPAEPDGEGGTRPERWDESRVLPLRVIVDERRIGMDEAGNPLTSPVPASGYWLAVSTPSPRDDLYALHACMREADRDLAEADRPYVLRERFTLEQLAHPWRLDRQWCGCDYSNLGA